MRADPAVDPGLGRGPRFGQVALGVAALTLTARILGFGRQLVFSKTVGDTCLGDAYNSANQLPNVLFEIVAGGILASVVVPVISQQLVQASDPNSAGDHHSPGSPVARTTSALLCWALLILTPIAVAATAGAKLYATSFVQARCPGGVETAAGLLVIFAPQIWFYGLAVISAGVLQAHQRFTAAAAAPLASSVVVIIAYLIFGSLANGQNRNIPADLNTSALAVLGWGTTAGVVMLALVTLVPLFRLGMRLRPTLRFVSGQPSLIIRIAGAGLIGLILHQLGLMVAMLTAKDSHIAGAWTRAVWANAVYLLPFAVLVSPLQQMIFPRLSAAATDGRAAVERVLAQIGPALCTLASLGAGLLIAASAPVARLLVLGPGSGSAASLAWPVVGYAPALIGFALLGLATRTLFAEHRARRAGLVNAAGWGVVIIALFAVRQWVPGEWAVTGIAVANSLGMAVGAGTGWVMITGGRSSRLGLLRPLVRDVPAGLVAGGVIGFSGRFLLHVGIVGSVLGAVAAALATAALFVGLLLVVDRRSLTGVLALRRIR